jgi:hypothetical protein
VGITFAIAIVYILIRRWKAGSEWDGGQQRLKRYAELGISSKEAINMVASESSALNASDNICGTIMIAVSLLSLYSSTIIIRV